jgi:DNA-binding transcriptional LysR family regulator
MRVDPRRLGVLGAVADAGGILAAAQVLHLTPSAISELTGHLTGPVVVGAFPTAIRHLVVPAAAALAEDGSGVTVQVRQVEPGPGQAALRAGALDMLVMESDTAQPRRRLAGLSRSWLLDDTYRVVVPAAWGAVAGIGALLTRPWVDGPVLGARRLDLIYRHGRHEPSPAARVVAQALKTRATLVGRASAQPTRYAISRSRANSSVRRSSV